MKRNSLLILSIIAILFLLFAQGIWVKQSVERDKERYAYELSQSLRNMFGFYLSKETSKKEGNIKIDLEPVDPKDLPKDAIVTQSFVSNQYNEDINMGNFLLGILANELLDKNELPLEPLDSLFRKEYPHYHEISVYSFTLNKKDSVLRELTEGENSQKLLQDTTSGVTVRIPIGDGRTYNFKAHVIFHPTLYTKRQLIASVISGVAIVLISLLILLQLVLLNRKTIQLDEMRQKVIGMVHDLKSPLNYVFSMLDTFGRKETDEKKHLQYQTGKIRVKYLTEKIEVLLTTLRITKNSLKMNPSTFNIIQVSHDIMKEIAYIYKTKEIHFSTSPEKEFLLYADPLFMEAALRNLLENAVKYGNERVQISFQATMENGFITLKVADDGIGISPVNQKKIFKNFYRIDKMPSLKSHGVGLSFTKQIIKSHGGKIDLESIPGKGSVFIITLPQEKNFLHHGTK